MALATVSIKLSPRLSQPIHLITLINDNNLSVTLSTLGASIWSVKTPNNKIPGEFTELTASFEALDDWIDNPYSMGITPGRVTNRIGGAKYSYNNNDYTLLANEGENQLHGGPDGFSKRLWEHKVNNNSDNCSVIFSLVSEDGDQGFPGKVHAEVEYTLDNDNQLTMHYRATTDKVTPINLTNHTYWNLSGNLNESITNHQLTIHAAEILELTPQSIPTGEVLNINGGIFDFQQAKAIGQDIDQLEMGYDNFYIFNKKDKQLDLVANLADPVSGREMDVYSTELGVQLYTGNYLDGLLTDVSGKLIKKHDGVCLETHGYPDAVNHKHFPSVMVGENKTYEQTTILAFKNLV